MTKLWIRTERWCKLKNKGGLMHKGWKLWKSCYEINLLSMIKYGKEIRGIKMLIKARFYYEISKNYIFSNSKSRENHENIVIINMNREKDRLQFLLRYENKNNAPRDDNPQCRQKKQKISLIKGREKFSMNR